MINSLKYSVVDVIVRAIKGEGYLPVVSCDGVVVIQGDLKQSATEAFTHAHQLATAFAWEPGPRFKL